MAGTAPLSVAGPIQPGSEEAKQAFMGSAPGFRFTGTGADGDRFKDHPVTEFARVVVKSNNLQASDYYKQQASRGRISTSSGYFIVKTEMMPATDPHVQQVILQMRKDRFKK
jgi:hypothetical protein